MRRILGRNKKGKTVYINIPSWDDLSFGGGTGGTETGFSGSIEPTPSPTQRINYQLQY